MENWKNMIAFEMNQHGETLADIVSSTLTVEEMEVMFDDDYGLPEGKPFTVWTAKRVYFPVCYDGAESVASVARNPDGVATKHVGGY